MSEIERESEGGAGERKREAQAVRAAGLSWNRDGRGKKRRGEREGPRGGKESEREDACAGGGGWCVSSVRGGERAREREQRKEKEGTYVH